MPDFPNEQEVSLPPRPDEPLASDCCGSGCNPCVFDIYEKELKVWESECKFLLEDKTSQSTQSNLSEVASCLSQFVFTPFEILSIHKVSVNTAIYRFKLPEGSSLGLKVGQHIIARYEMEPSLYVCVRLVSITRFRPTKL